MAEIILIFMVFLVTSSWGQHQGFLLNLENVTFFKFNKGEETIETQLRLNVQQLQCIGNECNHEIPNEVICYNKGTDGLRVQWKCESQDLPQDFKFHKTKVVCEKFDEDPKESVVFNGSCFLEYSLEKKLPSTLGDYDQARFILEIIKILLTVIAGCLNAIFFILCFR